jgi:hypothetical protein
MPGLAVGPDSVYDLSREVQAPSLFFEKSNHAQALLVVPIPTPEQVVESILTGMAEGSMSKVVGEPDRLGEILIETQSARYVARYLGHFEDVAQTGGVVIAGGGNEHLRLASQAPERVAMNDPVPVALVTRPDRGLFLGALASRATAAVGGVRRQDSIFRRLNPLSYGTGPGIRQVHKPV